LWESRFKSVIVEDGYALRMVAAYIDLNPVRAGMVERPEDYKWSSYGEAMCPKANKGRKLARSGICRVLGKMDGAGDMRTTKGANPSLQWEDGVAELYRMMLFSDGEEVFVDCRESGEVAKRVRKGFKRKDVEKVLKNGGKLTFGEALRCRVRYLSDGIAVGSRGFVDGIFEQSRELFGEKRQTGARVMREVGWKEKNSRLYTMRQLRKKVVE